MKIYLSGPIAGVPDYKVLFDNISRIITSFT